jgi:hypothetical protein
MKRFFIRIVAFFLCTCLNGQNISGRLSLLFSRLENTTDKNERIIINDSIRIIIDGFAASDSVFDKNIDGSRFLGQITSSDNNIKIINWNLIQSDSLSHYFCYIIRRGEKENKNSIYRLTGINSDVPLHNDTIYTSKNWYGALYYAISPVKIKKETYYMLLGIDIGNNFINRKLIDVLSFSPDGEPVFGKKWFDNGKKILSRVIFEYDATGTMSLKFRSPRTIVFDHLVPLYRGDRQKLTFGAEYTLDSYTWKDGKWKFEPDVEAKNKE